MVVRITVATHVGPRAAAVDWDMKLGRIFATISFKMRNIFDHQKASHLRLLDSTLSIYPFSHIPISCQRLLYRFTQTSQKATPRYFLMTNGAPMDGPSLLSVGCHVYVDFPPNQESTLRFTSIAARSFINGRFLILLVINHRLLHYYCFD